MGVATRRRETGKAAGTATKPPYHVPLMAELDSVPRNGFRVMSTFSGAGGSCLGYRLAGYEVVWASEFIDEARKTYRANFPETPLDDRDIREVDPLQVLAELGIGPGEIDVLEGSPPCASFSMAGAREKHWGQEKLYSGRKQRTDDLFAQFLRFVELVRPRVFTAENVPGLTRGTARGHFNEILRDFRALGYRTDAALLDAQWLGVPQARQRIFFVGVREDLGLDPVFPEPLPYRYSVLDAIPWLLDAGVLHTGTDFAQRTYSVEEPSRTIPAQIQGRHHPAVMTRNGPRSAEEPAPTILSHGRQKTNSELTVIRGDMAIAPEWDRLRPGGKSSRYFQLQKAAIDEPCWTITAEAGRSPGVAGPVHPVERRKFTIEELRRLCSFPDDFVLTGTYAKQWERLGRAVPPLMMRAVAIAIRDGILSRLPK